MSYIGIPLQKDCYYTKVMIQDTLCTVKISHLTLELMQNRY